MTKYNFITKKSIAFIITAVILVAGLASFIIGGFNLGVDFVGGAKISVTLKDDPSDKMDDIEAAVKDVVGEDKFMDLIQSSANKKTVIATIESVVSFDRVVGQKLAEVYGVSADVVGSRMVNDDDGSTYFTFNPGKDSKVEKDTVKEALNALNKDNDVFSSHKVAEDGTVTVYYNSTSYEQMVVDRVNASVMSVADQEINTISKNRATAQTITALIAAGIAIVLMLVYITFRFKQFASGLSAVACLFFNLFVMFACYSIFRWEMTLDIIPACLTILGYSINATIVIFDRIRENAVQASSFDEAANNGVHSTMLRSINTTITTLITIVLVYILGVESIKAFALPLIIGIFAGLFSSVFLASPIWVVLRKWFKVEERAAAKAAK